MIVVTGAAGLIGSALIAGLNLQGRTDILAVDRIDHPRKQRNLAPLRFAARLDIDEFRRRLNSGGLDDAGIRAILHMGACSDTSEQDWDYLADNNVACSQEIIRWSIDHGARCIYASSAATYGDGSLGFDDSADLFDRLRPLNPYGRSKLVVDIWARDHGLLDRVAGLRYFNVFGPNEWHKGGMRSVINKKYPEMIQTGRLTLFRSHHPDYADGAQERDFIYVKDAVAATLWLLEHPEANGVFNIGTGKARTWNDVAHAMFAAAGLPARIDYIDMPENLRAQYQYHTCARMQRLRSAGYQAEPTSLEAAIADYIGNYLAPDRHLLEQ
ncbi:MAG: ADP-glyceromanno-heptose 6-epimerase [Verrucomicrobia bacterium]|nr:MAG: ADP-glyceromanno-heptose 6-epimerase [Verrucomicrobiota bacterium]